MSTIIRLTVPSIDEEDVAAVSAVLRSGFLVQGAKVLEFERTFADYVGTKFAVATTNCTEALFLSLSAANVGAGDKVAVCTYSWPATANAIELVGAVPRFVEIENQTFNMDPNRLEDLLRKEHVKAVLPVHTFGGPADMTAIESLSNRHNAVLIEDAACALGTAIAGRRVGAFGKVGCFSLHPRKAITTGEGGMMTTDDAAFADRLRVLRNHGQAVGSPRPDFIVPAHNLRMTEFQAAFGLSQFKKLERIVAARTAGAERYAKLLNGTDIRPPAILPTGRHVYQSYVVYLPERARGRTFEIVDMMRERGIETTIGTYHMPLTTFYAGKYGFKAGSFPVTDDVAARALTLPLYEELNASDQQRVVSILVETLDRICR